MTRRIVLNFLACISATGLTNAALAHESTPWLDNQTINTASAEWAQNTRISGLLLGELIASNYNQGKNARFGEKNPYSTWCFPRAVLTIDNKMTEYAQGHFSFNFRDSCGYGNKNDEWSFTKFGRTDEAFLVLANPKQTPFFARVGIQYLPYGDYQRHHIPATFPQLLTQTQNAGLTLGYTKSNCPLQAQIYSFSSKPQRTGTQRINNGGIRVQYHNTWKNLSSQFYFDAMYNIAGGVNYIVHQGSCCASSANPLNTGYRKHVSGTSVTAKFKKDKWDAAMQYTTALGHFHVSDLAWQTTEGAKPAAWQANLGYRLTPWKNREHHISGSYHRSQQAVNLRGNTTGRGLPKYRLQADYEMTVWKNAKMGAHLVWDHDYKTAQGGTAGRSLTGMLSMLIAF